MRREEASFREPDELLDEVVDALAAVGEEHEGRREEARVRAEGVNVLDELAEAEGLAAEAEAGLEGLEARGGGRGQRPSGEREARGVAGDLEELVDAVAAGEVGLQVGEEVAGRRARSGGALASLGGHGGCWGGGEVRVGCGCVYYACMMRGGCRVMARRIGWSRRQGGRGEEDESLN